MIWVYSFVSLESDTGLHLPNNILFWTKSSLSHSFLYTGLKVAMIWMTWRLIIWNDYHVFKCTKTRRIECISFPLTFWLSHRLYIYTGNCLPKWSCHMIQTGVPMRARSGQRPSLSPGRGALLFIYMSTKTTHISLLGLVPLGLQMLMYIRRWWWCESASFIASSFLRYFCVPLHDGSKRPFGFIERD